MQHFGERLKAARKIKGWSLQELVSKTSHTVSKQALSKYEAGVMMPSRKILLLLSGALGVKPTYFESQPVFNLPEFEIPRKGDLSAKQSESIKEKVKDLLEHYLQAEALLNIRSKFTNPIKPFPVPDEQAAADVAAKLLSKWGLGNGALHNVTEMLEEKGVRVIQVSSPDYFEGLSTYVGKVPVIVLHKDRPTAIKRFAAMYELGQLLLKITTDTDKRKIPVDTDRHKICEIFAAAMLLPGNALETLLGSKRMAIAPGELICIKEQYGLPLRAIMQQAVFKGIIDRKNANAFFKLLVDNADETDLGNYIGEEKAQRFDRMVYRLVAEGIIDIEKAADLARIPVEELQQKVQVFDTVVQD
ncbi:XRE family transcriptional regulator [Chitinophaga filiformis]|uniref:Zn-dependent peptidase ImmA, M78 family n=1 Tax=Chitinophaga filiformis TaxID=104663 RepID=A0A1G7HJ70_CHIFI|nr:XRE family transcriptional regulator [Chitinophaga filiformis]SDF00373.1 Zn-dependent peptidase ImmA, M78 family [Chitinophaga filiformis]